MNISLLIFRISVSRSNHAMMAFSLYMLFTIILWKSMKTRFSRTLLLLFASSMIFMICISRIYLGVHYPSDVIAGIAASGFLLSMFIFLFRAFGNKCKKGGSENIPTTFRLFIHRQGIFRLPLRKE